MRNFTVILLLLAVLSNDVLAKKHRKHHPKKNGGKIVGGHDATIQDYPYQAAVFTQVGEYDYIACGGAIISTSYVLTAAHCFANAFAATIRIGSTNKYDGGEQYTCTFEVHADYNPTLLDYDIAVLKTDEEMALDGTNAKTVTIVEKGFIIPSGSMVTISGWGDTEEDGDDSDTLRAVDVPTWSNEECSENQQVTDRQFCAGFKEGGKGDCEGDSGGPIVLTESGVLVGLVSGAVGCARPNSPSSHTNITSLRDWVKEKTGI